MKRKRPEQPERRHTMVELNLADHEQKTRSLKRPAGCASILSRLGLMVAIIAAVAALGLR